MHIGVDFDNTIVCYDALFHRVAVDQRLVPCDLAATKLAVRHHLRINNREDAWTEMQGHVYGARMNEAAIYPGFLEFVQRARVSGNKVSIVSHKSRLPFAGPPYDLHAAARSWIDAHLLHEGRPLFADDAIHLELTSQEKLARIRIIDCDVFIDDLPEILLAATIPSRLRKLLFDPDSSHAHSIASNLLAVTSWADASNVLLR